MPSWIGPALQLAQIAAVLASAGVSLWVYVRSRSDKRDEALRESVAACSADVEGLTAEVSALSLRLALAEKAVQDVPSHHDLEGIRLQVAGINGQVTALNERTMSTHNAVVRIEQFLMGAKR
jgi:hypothetical protein